MRRCRDGRERERVARRWPELHDARALAEADGERRWEVEARLLAGQGDDEIAGHTGLSAGVVGLFASLFFHVRARLGASSWVLSRAIWRNHTLSTSMPDVGVVWRSVAYFGRPLVLEIMLSATLNRPLPAWVREGPYEADPGYGERLRTRARLLAQLLMLPPGARLSDLVRLQVAAEVADEQIAAGT